MKEIEKFIVSILGNETLSQKEVCERLKSQYGIEMQERVLRKHYDNIRSQFAAKEIDFTILFNNRGNYVSYDFNSIKRSNNACRKTAFAILKNAYARDKRINNDDQLTFVDYIKILDKEFERNGEQANV